MLADELARYCCCVFIAASAPSTEADEVTRYPDVVWLTPIIVFTAARAASILEDELER
jgi:hypothetical protein